MAQKEISLSVGERLRCIQLFNGFKGDIATLSNIIDDVKKFSIDEDESKLLEIETITTKDKDGNDVPSIKWNQEKEVPVTLSLERETIDYLTGEIKKKSDAKEITLTDMPLIELNKKLLAL